MTEKFKHQIVGLGPAALGVPVAADRIGKLDQLLREGTAFIDKGPLTRTGRGKLHDLQIRSNSPGGDFLEGVRKDDGVFSKVLQHDSARRLAEAPNDIVPLLWVAEFLEALRWRFCEVLEHYPTSRIIPDTTISKITCGDGPEQSRFIAESADKRIQIASDNLVLATGASEVENPYLGKEGQRILSHDVLDGSAIPRLREMIEGKSDPLILILGFSHSAFSAAWNLLQHFPDPSPLRIQIVPGGHQDPKIFYASAQQAAQDGYVNYSGKDVCPTTGRVYRFGGLRGDAKDLAKRIADGRERRVFIQKMLGPTERHEHFLPAPAHTCAIIKATGYRGDSIPLFDREGRKIGPKKVNPGTFHERVAVTPQAAILTTEGRIVEGAYAMGFGHGLEPSRAVGGEPSFTRPLDGVNVFHGIVAELILGGLFKNS